MREDNGTSTSMVSSFFWIIAFNKLSNRSEWKREKIIIHDDECYKKTLLMHKVHSKMVYLLPESCFNSSNWWSLQWSSVRNEAASLWNEFPSFEISSTFSLFLILFSKPYSDEIIGLQFWFSDFSLWIFIVSLRFELFSCVLLAFSIKFFVLCKQSCRCFHRGIRMVSKT